MEEHAETKFKSMQEIKKKYTVQIALAQKVADLAKVAQLDSEFKEAKKRCEAQYSEKSTAGKNRIKLKYNEMALQQQVDTDSLIRALTGDTKFKQRVEIEADLDDLNFDAIKL